MKQRKEHVYIAIPAVDGRVEAGLAHLLSIAERHTLSPKSPWRFTKEIFVGYSPVEWMRNSIFHDFLESGASRLWMLDSDILPPANAFDILGSRYDVTGGLVTAYKQARDGSGIAMQACAFERRRDGVWDSILPPTADREVDGVGGGCMLIRRAVLTDKRMDIEPVADGDPRSLYRVWLDRSGRYVNTGDVEFCWRAKSTGYSVGVWAGGWFGQRESLDLRDVVAYGAACARQASARVAV